MISLMKIIDAKLTPKNFSQVGILNNKNYKLKNNRFVYVNVY